MKKVNPVAQMGQGSVPPCVCEPFASLLPPDPVLGEAWSAEEASELVPPERPGGFSALMKEPPRLELQPSSELAVEPRAYRTLEEGILRALSRRAARTIRPFIQSVPQQELWVAGFDERCRPVDFRRLVPGPQGQLSATVALVLGWAEATGTRAFVLVQNQPGPRRAAISIDLSFTLQLAAAAELSHFILVDHVVIHNAGAPTLLRQRRLLPEVQLHAAQLQQSIGALASAHPCFGVLRPPAPKATLP